jgi:AbrB family looped-hinge helix DNA binding protein
MDYSVATSKGQVVIPRSLRKKYGIKPGTKVAFLDQNGEIVLKALTKEYFAGFAGLLKGDDSLLGELMKEKAKEKKL